MSSPSKSQLKVDWCTHAAAKYAVENWHYSKRMPMPPLVMVGVWEAGRYVGVVLFSRGANQNIASPYGLQTTEVCELVRVALTSHAAPVTRIVAIALKFLRKSNPGLQLVVSYADPSEGHHGGIYQGGNWIYTGCSSASRQWFHEGRWKHSREVTSGAFGRARKIRDWSQLPARTVPGKHRYLMPLTEAARKGILSLSKPYPKPICARSADSGTPGNPAGRGQCESDPSAPVLQPEEK